jgi:hypothetical protein
MGLVGATLIVVLISVMSVAADELPSRKVGLWEVKTSLDNRSGPPLVIKQCIDAATDQMLQSNAGPYSQEACTKRDVQRSANSMTIDSTCAVAGKTGTAHAVVVGSFDSAYTMTVTAQGEGTPGGKMTMTMEGKWLGPCTADQKPGDVIMGNGMKINILEAQKYHPSPDTSPR